MQQAKEQAGGQGVAVHDCGHGRQSSMRQLLSQSALLTCTLSMLGRNRQPGMQLERDDKQQPSYVLPCQLMCSPAH